VAAAPAIAPHALPAPGGSENLVRGKPPDVLQTAEFPGVSRGRELTRKDRRLSSTLSQLDGLIAGGIARGRISEIVGRTSSGKTTLAASFAASATRRGETAAWIDLPGAFDPSSVEAAGADLGRILWVGFDGERRASSAAGLSERPRSTECRPLKNRKDPLRAVELVLEAGGFGLVVIDFGAMRYPLANGAALRLARAAERSAAAVLVLAARRMCGTFAALVLSLGRVRPRFSRPAARAPVLFDGLRIEVTVARNKLGALGRRLVCDVSQCRTGTIPRGAEAPDAAAAR
jgi:recA bacterial DNA recombination protein